MDLLLHNASRSIANRNLRAARASHQGLCIYVLNANHRLIRGRPLKLNEEMLLTHLEEIRAGVKSGTLEVTTLDLRPFDVETLEASPSVEPKAPDMKVDCVQNDPVLPTLKGPLLQDEPVPFDFSMPVAPPDAAIDVPIDFPSERTTNDLPKHHQGKKNR